MSVDLKAIAERAKCIAKQTASGERGLLPDERQVVEHDVSELLAEVRRLRAIAGADASGQVRGSTDKSR